MTNLNGSLDRNDLFHRVGLKPIHYAQLYLWGGFIVFLLTGRALNLENFFPLLLIVSSGNIALFFGYLYGARSNFLSRWRRTLISEPSHKSLAKWIFWGSIYYICYSVLHLQEYGASGFDDVQARLLNPGDAYASKFDVYESQMAEGRVNVGIQIIVLFGALQGALIPILVVFWSKISRRLRYFAVFSIVLYCVFFLFIGTMKGLGDVLIYAGVGFLVRYSRDGLDLNRPRLRGRQARWRLFLLVIIAGSFLTYMVNSMQSRLDVLGGGVEEKGIVEEICYVLGGDSLGAGMAVAVLYPVAGYYGLDKNLSQPFEWAYGLGGSRALSSYKTQYFGGEDYYELSYPARTERATGFPALMYWQTIYPWLASDFTYFGAVVAIGLVGVLWGGLWIESVFSLRPVAIVLFGQLCIFVIYIPANNQIFASRLSLIGLGTLVLLYLFQGLSRSRRSM